MTQEANFGDTPVYLDAMGIVNVLSLYRLGQKFKVTYDSEDRGGVFKGYTKAGVVEFMPTVKGLHALNLKDSLRLCTFLSMIQTSIITPKSRLFERITRGSLKNKSNRLPRLAVKWV